jgi:polyhydroxyalkanoate synthase
VHNRRDSQVVLRNVSAPASAPFEQASHAAQALIQGFITALGSNSENRGAAQFAAWARNAPQVARLQAEYHQRFVQLWSAMVARQRGGAYEPVIAPERGDRRFSAAQWREDPWYDYLKQSYLLNARFLQGLVESADVDDREKRKLHFFARQVIDMMSPANFAATNPEALAHALESNGETLARGVRNLIGDVEKGRISQTDDTAFEVGRNLAVAPGAVVFENELMQLIQYAPKTPRVRRYPLVMVPPSINKFYILDLSPENSFVRYAVERGNTVFMVSWRNVTAELGGLTWDDYIRDGIVKALEVARAITRAKKVNALGFCVGGTMLGTALALLAARGDERVESATLLTTMLDFSNVGDIGVFVDQASVTEAEGSIGKGGVKSGRDLATVFNALRPNDLVWSYVVKNYLKGESPEAFDILYWNADSTNLPGPYYCWYIRNTYLENNLRTPGRVSVCGIPIDLGKIRIPVYLLASREDHIVPWQTAYLSTNLLAGANRFVLAASGHIAGVINPASKNRRSYWTNQALAASAEEWRANAVEQPGSWWTDWSRWLEAFGGGERRRPVRLGSAKYKPSEDAPGRYVRQRIA